MTKRLKFADMIGRDKGSFVDSSWTAVVFFLVVVDVGVPLTPCCPPPSVGTVDDDGEAKPALGKAGENKNCEKVESSGDVVEFVLWRSRRSREGEAVKAVSGRVGEEGGEGLGRFVDTLGAGRRRDEGGG